MTDKLKIDRLLEKHGLYAPADEGERERAIAGQTYFDVDLVMRKGKDIREQSQIPHEWKRESNPTIMLGRVLIVTIVVIGLVIIWIAVRIHALWPIIKVFMGGRP